MYFFIPHSENSVHCQHPSPFIVCTDFSPPTEVSCKPCYSKKDTFAHTGWTCPLYTWPSILCTDILSTKLNMCVCVCLELNFCILVMLVQDRSLLRYADFLLFHISSPWVKISWHTKNPLPSLRVTALKVFMSLPTYDLSLVLIMYFHFCLPIIHFRVANAEKSDYFLWRLSIYFIKAVQDMYLKIYGCAFLR